MIILNRREQASETFCSDDHTEQERTGQWNILFIWSYWSGKDRLVKHSVQMIILNRRGQVSETFCSDDCGTYWSGEDTLVNHSVQKIVGHSWGGNTVRRGRFSIWFVKDDRVTEQCLKVLWEWFPNVGSKARESAKAVSLAFGLFDFYLWCNFLGLMSVDGVSSSSTNPFVLFRVSRTFPQCWSDWGCPLLLQAIDDGMSLA